VLKLGTLWKVDQKYLKSSELWCWRRMEDISCTDRTNNKYYEGSRRKGCSYIWQSPGKLMGFVTSVLGTVFIKLLLKER
jgi:hypothetical protein